MSGTELPETFLCPVFVDIIMGGINKVRAAIWSHLLSRTSNCEEPSWADKAAAHSDFKVGVPFPCTLWDDMPRPTKVKGRTTYSHLAGKSPICWCSILLHSLLQVTHLKIMIQRFLLQARIQQQHKHPWWSAFLDVSCLHDKNSSAELLYDDGQERWWDIHLCWGQTLSCSRQLLRVCCDPPKAVTSAIAVRMYLVVYDQA